MAGSRHFPTSGLYLNRSRHPRARDGLHLTLRSSQLESVSMPSQAMAQGEAIPTDCSRNIREPWGIPEWPDLRVRESVSQAAQNAGSGAGISSLDNGYPRLLGRLVVSGD